MSDQIKRLSPDLDRVSLLSLLILIALGSWAFVLTGAGMANLHSLAPWSLPYAWVMILMWWGMMIAMMLPAIIPFILLHRRVFVGRFSKGSAMGMSLSLITGYFLIWGGFSVAATLIQWWLASSGNLNMMTITKPEIAGGLFILAGVYQLTPMKANCLENCQSPLAFVMQNWQPGARGSFAMGFKHGLYCLGCCWAIMLLLFASGVMNLYWIVALTIYVIVEKILPVPRRLMEFSTAVILISWGLYILISAH